MKNILIVGITRETAKTAEERAGAVCAEAEIGLKSLCVTGSGAPGRDAVLHLRTGQCTAGLAPLIPEGHCDLMIGADPGELVRNLRFLKKDGTAVLLPGTAENKAAVRKSGYDPEKCRDFLRRRLRNFVVLSETEVSSEKYIANCVGSI